MKLARSHPLGAPRLAVLIAALALVPGCSPSIATLYDWVVP
jgi:hypothetical protein